MLKYGLKLWSSNIAWFPEATALIKAGAFDYIELYHNADVPLEYQALAQLKGANVLAIHNPHSHGWHEFFLSGESHKQQWQDTLALANFFKSKYIVIHPSRDHSFPDFLANLKSVQDSRIIVENMAGRDIDDAVMNCGQTLADLKIIKQYQPICCDVEKAVKAARQQQCDEQVFISKCITELQPNYFHISGGDLTPVDQHWNLWEAEFDMAWIKQALAEYAQERDIFVTFEVPKQGNGLENDVKNLEYFKQL